MAWGALLACHQGRLLRMVAFRMDPRLRRRVDAADVVQEAFAEASEHRATYFLAPAEPLFLGYAASAMNSLRSTVTTHPR